jgi:hypothetical protein
MISPETDPTAHQRELSTSDKVNLINEIITEEVFLVDSSTDLAAMAVKIAYNIDKARNRVKFLPNADVYFDYLETIFGDISDSAGVEDAAIKILENAQSLIDAGVDEGITGDASSYTSSEIGKLTAMLRQQIAEEKARASAAETPTASPEDDDADPAATPLDTDDDLDIFDDEDFFDDDADLDIFDDEDFFDDDADPAAVTPPEAADTYNLGRIEFAFEIARRRLERQALERARQNKEAFTTHARIKDVLKQIYDAYHKNKDVDTHFATLADALGLNGITDAATKEKIETALHEGIVLTLFDALDSVGDELQKIENGTVDNPRNQLVTLKNSLLKLVTNLDSQLTDDADASADFANVKAEFLAAVQLLMQDYLLRYEAVAPAFAKPELQSIINALQAVIQGNLDPQDPDIRNILRPDADGGVNPFDTTSFITKGLSPAERKEQIRVVQNLEQKVAIVLGDEDRANKYENLTFTQSLEEILQLVEVVDDDPSLIIQVEQYWSQFLVGSDAAGGFDLTACFADTDLHAVAALQTKLTTQRNQIIKSFIDSELTPEQNQLAIEAVCVIDLCRNRLRVLLVEVAEAQAAAKAAAPESATAASVGTSVRREFDPLPETSNQLVMNYRKASLLGFFRKFMTEDVSGSEAVEAWSQVLKEKAARVEATERVAKQMKDFIKALDGPVEFKLFNVSTADFSNLTTLGPEVVEKKLSEDAIKVYDAFRSNELYATVVEKIGDLAYYLMYDKELEFLKKAKPQKDKNNIDIPLTEDQVIWNAEIKAILTLASSDTNVLEAFAERKGERGISTKRAEALGRFEASLKTLIKRLRFLLALPEDDSDLARDPKREEKIKDRHTQLNKALKTLVKYKEKGDSSSTFKFDWQLVTEASGEDNDTLQARNWVAKGDWSNGDKLTQFCAEIIFECNADAKAFIEGIDAANPDKDKPEVEVADENRIDWSKSDKRRDIPNLLMYIAQADSALRERRKKAAEFHLLYSKSAFKFPNSTKVGGSIFPNYVVYKVEKNNDTDAYASATALVEPDGRYVKVTSDDDEEEENGPPEILEDSTNRKALPRIQERYNEIIDFLAFRFAKSDRNGRSQIRRLIDSVKYKQRLVMKPEDLEITTGDKDHRNQIGMLGSASVPLSLDDFLTNYDRENKQRGSAADYAKLKQTVETLDSMFETVVNAWGNDKTEAFATSDDLENDVNKLFQALGSDIAKAFAYTSSLPEQYKSELFEIFKALYKSYSIYILGQLKRNPYKSEDEEYDTKYDIVCTAVQAYFNKNDSFLAPFVDRETKIQTDFVTVMDEFFEDAFVVLKQDNKYVANNLANQYVADIQDYNYDIELRDKEKREKVKIETIKKRIERANPGMSKAEVKAAVALELARQEKSPTQKATKTAMGAVRFLFSGGDIPSIDLTRLSKLPRWPFGTKVEKDASKS